MAKDFGIVDKVIDKRPEEPARGEGPRKRSPGDLCRLDRSGERVPDSGPTLRRFQPAPAFDLPAESSAPALSRVAPRHAARIVRFASCQRPTSRYSHG